MRKRSSAGYAVLLTLMGLASALQAACGPKPAPQAVASSAPAAPAVKPAPAPAGSLAWAAAGPWRFERERDKYLHPAETLTFFGLQPGMSVVQALPGRGWYTTILAPYLARGGGKLYAASFDPLRATDDQLATLTEFKNRFLKNPRDFGAVEVTVLSPKSGSVAPAGVADMVLAVDVTNAFMAEGYAEKAFKDFFAALKPGGVLGVVQMRARSSGLQDPQAGDGYVQEEYIKLLAKEAGFVFIGASEINANPKDTKDHPFGAWTLPPILRTAQLGMPDDPHFDTTKYIAIGEPDRMTLKFAKPAGPDGLRGASKQP